jgi:CheY-specific phosphatase CheX
MTTNWEKLLETTVPTVLTNLLRDWLGYDGVASICNSEWDGILRDQIKGYNYLVGESVILKISAFIEVRFADSLLRSLTGDLEAAVFEDDERLDAVAELSNMLAGRLSQGLRGHGVEMAIIHPSQKNTNGINLESHPFLQNLTWTWISQDHQIALEIAY